MVETFQYDDDDDDLHWQINRTTELRTCYKSINYKLVA